MTTHADPEGRPTVFDNLPEGLPRLISIGRLDFTIGPVGQKIVVQVGFVPIK